MIQPDDYKDFLLLFFKYSLPWNKLEHKLQNLYDLNVCFFH